MSASIVPPPPAPVASAPGSVESSESYRPRQVDYFATKFAAIVRGGR